MTAPEAHNPEARAVERTDLILTLLSTLASSFIWGINTIFLLDAGLNNAEAFAANAFFALGMVVFEIPTGVIVASGLKSWSHAVICDRLLPPRAKGPTLTVAFASMEIRNTSNAASAAAFCWFTWSKMASVSGIFFWVRSSRLFADSIPRR